MINDKQFIEAIHKQVYSNPDYVYEAPHSDMSDSGLSMCVYTDGVKPSCLIGHALYNCGVSIDQLSKFDSKNVSDIGQILSKNFDNISDPVKNAAGYLQGEQDGMDSSWEECLDRAIVEHPVLTSDRYIAKLIYKFDKSSNVTESVLCYFTDDEVEDIREYMHENMPAVSEEMIDILKAMNKPVDEVPQSVWIAAAMYLR